MMKTVEELAREAGGRTTSIPGDLHSDGGWFFEYEPDRACPSLERFAALVRQQALEEAAVDVKRYQWLREQHWSNGTLCVAAPEALTLGHDTFSRERLDEAIDDAIRAAGSKP